MGANSKIEWTHHTFNPWRGCTKVHEGCAHCYAERNMSVRLHGVKWGPNGTRVRLSDAGWKEPLKWNREAQKARERRRVFCASLADVFEDWQVEIRHHNGRILHRCQYGHWLDSYSVHAYGTECNGGCPGVCMPVTMDDLRRDLFALIDQTPWLDWLLLTKRPENVRGMWPIDYIDTAEDCEDVDERKFFAEGAVRKRLKNVWLGTSVSNQETADRMVPELLQCHDLCPVLFLSCEPLLGPLEVGRWLYSDYDMAAMDDQLLEPLGGFNYAKIRWVIVGGESGPQARPMHPEWVRSLRDQCEDSTPFFFKQWGEWLPALQDGARGDGQVLNCSDEPARVGKKKAGRNLDGREWSEFPS